MSYPRYEIFKDNKGEFRFNLHSINYEIILISSEGYKEKNDCKMAILICQNHSPLDVNYDRRITHGGNYYFTLRSSNWKDIGRSEDYTTVSKRENGISAVKRDGKIKTVIDKS
ncbi:MAG: YegP family protein [Chitinophagaceae bacterium]|nr:YegP family protein [Chitinophagaceae bacterium]